MEIPARLTEVQRRKLLLWKRLVVACIAGSGILMLVELGLLLWPGASRGLKVGVAGLLVEFVGSAAVLGAAGKCPACGARFGTQSQGLLPRRCPRCGVALG